MKITYEQLYMSYPIFNHLLNESLPIKTSLKFQELVESVNPYLLEIENIQNGLIEKYSEKTKEEGVVQIIEEKRDVFLKELEEALDKDIELKWESIKLDELGEDISISVRGLETISYLIEDYEKLAIV
tara:strand:+ start:2377 stop:2760 length:384 start_codon:yes stop_codon:yes gene_type:complete